jgi:hypothetical protein
MSQNPTISIEFSIKNKFSEKPYNSHKKLVKKNQTQQKKRLVKLIQLFLIQNFIDLLYISNHKDFIRKSLPALPNNPLLKLPSKQ